MMRLFLVIMMMLMFGKLHDVIIQTFLGFGKAYYPPPADSKSIVLDDDVLDFRLQPQLFSVSGPNERLIIRKNFPETWLWDNKIAGYFTQIMT